MNKKLELLLLAASFILTGCIKNDIPYARIPLAITALKVEGQVGETVFSEKNKTATVTLDETVNPKTVKVEKIEFTEKAVASLASGEVIDLSSNYQVKLSLYQDYIWNIVRNQPIERRANVTNQVGNAEFDTEERTVTIYITKSASLRKLKLTDLKLGPKGAAHNGTVEGVPIVSWKVFSNFATASVRVTFGDFIDEEWTIRVYNSDSDVITERADAWVNVIWMYGAGVVGAECGFEYREAGAEAWTVVPQEYLTVNGGRFSARVPHLKANTQYECRAYSGEDRATSVQVSTVGAVNIPNMGFEDWHQEGKVICPWAENGLMFWDTGNDGSTTLGENYNITTGVEEPRPGSSGKYAAKLSSRTIAGVFASGNLFIGEFKATKGMNGVLGFGRECTSYPTRLKGWFKYTPKPVKDNKEDGFTPVDPSPGEPDQCIVWVALGDWELSSSGSETGQKTAVEIRTSKSDAKVGKYFDKNDPHVIAYGEMLCGEEVNEYKPFEIELKYRATDRVPTSLLIICSASKYGDYFTGGDGSTMWVDDFSLEFDYDD